jgi:hypothetical protein
MSPHAAEGKGRDLVAVGIIGAARIVGKASTFMLASWLQPMDLQDAHTDRTP